MEINCPNCNKALELPDNAVGVKVRCSFCRATFIGEEPAVSLSAPAGSGSKFCPNCGAHTVAGFKFCANCGQSLGASKPVKVASRTPSATVDCVVCGKRMRESSAVKCPRCGNNVCKTHYNRKLNVCSQCVPDVMGELADKAVAVGESGDWTQALAIAKQCDKTDGRVLYVYAQAYHHWVPTIAYRNWEHNAQKFSEYLRASAIAGYAPAQFEMDRGHSGCDNFRNLPWMTKAAEQDYVPAQMELARKAQDGYRLTNSDARVRDLSLAFKWYRRAAENGNEEACYQVALCYFDGIGTSVDTESGKMWLVRAADKNHPKALCRLGDEYRTGGVCGQDAWKALDCYSKSADMGCSSARKYILSSMAQTKYIAIDLRGGPNAKQYPVVELNEQDDDIRWNEEMKTDYLLLRRIESGAAKMGDPARYNVVISKPFYIGVFQVTQRQWELVMGSRPAYFRNELYYKTRPIENVTGQMVRELIGTLRVKTNLEFELPTSAQWEFACRAGTVSRFNDGRDVIDDDTLGRLDMPSESGPDDATGGTVEVGLYRPNKWGLYDMHGNVCELCHDDWRASEDAVDPIGNEHGALRGGSWCSRRSYSGSSDIVAIYNYDSYKSNWSGLRVALLFEAWDSPRLDAMRI